jgi:hypothetical protein
MRDQAQWATQRATVRVSMRPPITRRLHLAARCDELAPKAQAQPSDEIVIKRPDHQLSESF